MWVHINNDKELNTLAFFVRNERERFKEIKWRAHQKYPIAVGLDEYDDNNYIVFGLVLTKEDSRKAIGDTSLSSFLRAKKEKWSQKSINN